MHLVLWAIEHALAGDHAPLRVVAIRAAFRKPVYLDTEVVLTGAPGALRVASADGLALELALEVAAGAPAATEVAAGAWPEPVAPDEPPPDGLAAAHGTLALALDPARAAARFPIALARLGATAIAELLGLTRLVGMQCPGLHSLFGGLALTGAAGPPALDWRVTAARLRYGMLTLGVRGPTLAGTLDAFVRPSPRRLALADARRLVPAGTCAGWRALVVGGTRGLGEAFALAIAAGGGDVCLTYHRGRDDADRVAAEVRGAGVRAEAIALDVLAPALAWPWPEPPTHVFYLAAPVLHSIRKGAPFRTDELERLVRYFCTGLHATVAALGAPVTVWTPSTTMLDAPGAALGAAYCAAKAAMEALCAQLPHLLPGVTVRCPRVGRVDTDQTASVVPLPPAPAIDEAARHVRDLGAPGWGFGGAVPAPPV